MEFIKKYYKPLLQGFLTLTALVIFFNVTDNRICVVSEANVSRSMFIFLNSLGFIFYGLLLSILFFKVKIYKIALLIMLLMVVIFTDGYLATSENPISMPLLILFWMAVVYLIFPRFFKTYRVAIFSIYGLIIAYHLVDFGTTTLYEPADRKNFAYFMMAPVPFFIGLWGYDQWRWFKTLKMEKAKAELALLKSQINPHFFFNTLNNLYGLVVEKSESAPEVVLKLSDMMRYTIYEGKEDLVNLSDEVQYLERYIALHKIRYQKTVDIQFDYAIDEEVQVAPLLFIILLENAFKHGVESLTEDAFIHMHLKTKYR